jgi:hypothetical protein
MAEVTTVVSDPGGDPGAAVVAGEAAVIAGAALATAEEAGTQAEAAEGTAGVGVAVSAEAMAQAQAAELRAMSVDEKLDRLVTMQLAGAMAAKPAEPAGEVVVAAPSPPSVDEPPKSLAKREKKERRSLRERWDGGDSA